MGWWWVVTVQSDGFFPFFSTLCWVVMGLWESPYVRAPLIIKGEPVTSRWLNRRQQANAETASHR
jgi:hypothetical protein